MRIAAIGDLHVQVTSVGLVESLLEGVEREADVLLLAGDLTNVGLPEEMAVLLRELKPLSIPVIAVVGNHDHENDHHDQLVDMMRAQGICVLDCSSCVIGSVGFAGTKGFCGGFGRWEVATFGERALKTFVGESINESERLDEVLEAMDTPTKIVLLHYAPTRETLKGEAEEIYPFLGASRLAAVVEKHDVRAVFHGHAHHGSPRGRTHGGVMVYNVARFVQERFADKSYLVLEV